MAARRRPLRGATPTVLADEGTAYPHGARKPQTRSISMLFDKFRGDFCNMCGALAVSVERNFSPPPNGTKCIISPGGAFAVRTAWDRRP